MILLNYIGINQTIVNEDKNKEKVDQYRDIKNGIIKLKNLNLYLDNKKEIDELIEDISYQTVSKDGLTEFVDKDIQNKLLLIQRLDSDNEVVKIQQELFIFKKMLIYRQNVLNN